MRPQKPALIEVTLTWGRSPTWRPHHPKSNPPKTQETLSDPPIFSSYGNPITRIPVVQPALAGGEISASTFPHRFPPSRFSRCHYKHSPGGRTPFLLLPFPSPFLGSLAPTISPPRAPRVDRYSRRRSRPTFVPSPLATHPCWGYTNLSLNRRQAWHQEIVILPSPVPSVRTR